MSPTMVHMLISVMAGLVWAGSITAFFLLRGKRHGDRSRRADAPAE